MDGILADFVDGICKTFDRPNPYDNGHTGWSIEDAPEFEGISRSKMFSVTRDPAWWEALPKMPEADEIVDIVTDLFPADSICVCTAPTIPVAPSVEGKINWLKAHYPGTELYKKIIPTNQKFFLASPWTILLDDGEKNTVPFVEEGGHVVLYPRPWNRCRHEQGFDLRAELKEAIERASA